MSRNMKSANTEFFNKIKASLSTDFISQVPNSIRYVATDDTAKHWLQYVSIKHTFQFSKDTYALLLLLDETEYLCLINVAVPKIELPHFMGEDDVNPGLITVLGSEGYLTPVISKSRQYDILNRVLYDTTDIEYHGHDWTEIEGLFPTVNCFPLAPIKEDVFYHESKNAFFQLLCIVSFEFSLESNPYGAVSKDAWEKIFYEKDLTFAQYRNLLLAYNALSWDISYLYLYQCLEDQFARNAVYSLHKKLSPNITELELSQLLYDELSWQPKDLEGLESLLSKYTGGLAVSLLTEIAGGMNLSKFIYTIRNKIVHETREPPIPLNDSEKWEKAIAGVIYLILNNL